MIIQLNLVGAVETKSLDLNQDNLQRVPGNASKLRSKIFLKMNCLSLEFRSHEPKFVQTCAKHTVSTDPQTMDSRQRISCHKSVSVLIYSEEKVATKCIF